MIWNLPATRALAASCSCYVLRVSRRSLFIVALFELFAAFRKRKRILIIDTFPFPTAFEGRIGCDDRQPTSLYKSLGNKLSSDTRIRFIGDIENSIRFRFRRYAERERLNVTTVVYYIVLCTRVEKIQILLLVSRLSRRIEYLLAEKHFSVALNID